MKLKLWHAAGPSTHQFGPQGGYDITEKEKRLLYDLLKDVKHESEVYKHEDEQLQKIGKVISVILYEIKALEELVNPHKFFIPTEKDFTKPALVKQVADIRRHHTSNRVAEIRTLVAQVEKNEEILARMASEFEKEESTLRSVIQRARKNAKRLIREAKEVYPF